MRPEIEMGKNIYLYFRQAGIKIDIINQHFLREFVGYDLYFVQDENNLINPLLQVGSGSLSLGFRQCNRAQPLMLTVSLSFLCLSTSLLSINPFFTLSLSLIFSLSLTSFLSVTDLSYCDKPFLVWHTFLSLTYLP